MSFMIIMLKFFQEHDHRRQYVLPRFRAVALPSFTYFFAPGVGEGRAHSIRPPNKGVFFNYQCCSLGRRLELNINHYTPNMSNIVPPSNTAPMLPKSGWPSHGPPSSRTSTLEALNPPCTLLHEKGLAIWVLRFRVYRFVFAV